MSKITDWLIRRFVMNKVKAFFGGLFDTKASEFWAGWAGIIFAVLTKIPAAGIVVTGLDWAATNIFQAPDVESLIAILLTYAAARMGKKAANAPAE